MSSIAINIGSIGATPDDRSEAHPDSSQQIGLHPNDTPTSSAILIEEADFFAQQQTTHIYPKHQTNGHSEAERTKIFDPLSKSSRYASTKENTTGRRKLRSDHSPDFERDEAHQDDVGVSFSQNPLLQSKRDEHPPAPAAQPFIADHCQNLRRPTTMLSMEFDQVDPSDPNNAMNNFYERTNTVNKLTEQSSSEDDESCSDSFDNIEASDPAKDVKYASAMTNFRNAGKDFALAAKRRISAGGAAFHMDQKRSEKSHTTQSVYMEGGGTSQAEGGQAQPPRLSHTSPVNTLNQAQQHTTTDPVVVQQENINHTIYESKEKEEEASHSSSLDSQESSEEGGPQTQLEDVGSRKHRKSRNLCQKYSIFNSRLYLAGQVTIQAIYCLVLVVSMIKNGQNYTSILDLNVGKPIDALVEPTPIAIKDHPQFKDSNDLLDTLYFAELLILALLVFDQAVKIGNHLAILKLHNPATVNPTVIKEHPQEAESKLSILFDSGRIEIKGEPLISTSTLVMDFVMLVVLLAAFALQGILQASDSFNYFQLGALLISRIYFRLPFTVALIVHHYQLRLSRIQQNIIFPNKEHQEFVTYKEKVLYIINQIRSQFRKVIYMNNPANDLAWCAFIIENDYLQISNSISSSQTSLTTTLPSLSKMSSMEGDSDQKKEKTKTVKNDSRRFSKTISLNFGERNQNTVDSLKMKRIEKIARDCASGYYNELVRNCEDLEEGANFEEYFQTNAYNAYSIDKAVNGNALYFTLMFLTNKLDWKNTIPKFEDRSFRNLAYKLQLCYRKNPYHNQIHAADVVQNLYFMLNKQDVKQVCQMSQIDIFCTFVSGAAHDIDHPGTNNLFEIKCRSKLAILYNDVSVLENHHAASFFFMLDNAKHDCNIFQDMPDVERSSCRKQILENILCTDMSKHGQIQGDIAALGELPEDQRKLDSDNKMTLIKALVHAADICNSARPFNLAKIWSENLFREFFNQGDKERALGLEISYLCDRTKFNFAQSQIGFLSFVTGPYFQVISTVLPKFKEQVGELDANTAAYKPLVEVYEEELKGGNKKF